MSKVKLLKELLKCNPCFFVFIFVYFFFCALFFRRLFRESRLDSSPQVDGSWPDLKVGARVGAQGLSLRRRGFQTNEEGRESAATHPGVPAGTQMWSIRGLRPFFFFGASHRIPGSETHRPAPPPPPPPIGRPDRRADGGDAGAARAGAAQRGGGVPAARAVGALRPGDSSTPELCPAPRQHFFPHPTAPSRLRTSSLGGGPLRIKLGPARKRPKMVFLRELGVASKIWGTNPNLAGFWRAFCLLSGAIQARLDPPLAGPPTPWWMSSLFPTGSPGSKEIPFLHPAAVRRRPSQPPRPDWSPPRSPCVLKNQSLGSAPK